MDYIHGQSNDFPLRILVPSDSVGAIIGKQGSTVRQIKQKTNTKIDVNKNEAPNSQERVIVFLGQPENCVQACREILQIMYHDARNKNKTNEIILKVLAHNNLIGRIIGKGGNIINSIKKETDTNITVSNITELNAYNVERIISVKGELDQQIRALETIYAKLCSAYENDNARAWNYSGSQYQQQQSQQHQYPFMHHFTPPTVMMPNNGMPVFSAHYAQQQQPIIHPIPSNNSNSAPSKYVEHLPHPTTVYHPPYYPQLVPVTTPYFMSYPSTATPMIPPYSSQYSSVATNANGNFNPQQYSTSIVQSSQNTPAVIETVHLYVPNTVIGAIIGTKGLFIKSIINNSNASVKISPLSPHEDPNKIVERQVTISGTPEAQWKSQYYIYDKIRQEGYAGNDEVQLRAEIYVPTTLIGRLVGKGGQNVRHLQQFTGATIKLPEDSQQTLASEVPVKIFGTFQASQFVQRRIQSIIQTSRDSINTSNEDSNFNNNNYNHNHNDNSEQFDNTHLLKQSSSSLNDSLTIVNGSTNSDDAVVAASTIRNLDDSITAVDQTKPSDE